MYISITYPVADFRSLHRENAGRLERPAWGRADPQAQFARGFGAIHTRTKSGNGFVGENYYADCDNLVRFPDKLFLAPFAKLDRPAQIYPFYRRFYFDGVMAGRFELGFRLDDGFVERVTSTESKLHYNAAAVAKSLLKEVVRIDLMDERQLTQPLSNAMHALRDGWILSSTRSVALQTFDIDSVGSRYVGVGKPFVFIRGGQRSMLEKDPQMRALLNQNDFRFFVTRSGAQGQTFDTALISSAKALEEETARERLARLFYLQIRTLAFAHSFYLRQVAGGKISGPRSLEPALQSLITRLSELEPLEGQKNDALACDELREILRSADIDTKRLSREIEEQLKPSWFSRNFRTIFGYFDRKTDLAIEAAASAATKHILSGGP
jgi:hypothetical protein